MMTEGESRIVFDGETEYTVTKGFEKDMYSVWKDGASIPYKVRIGSKCFCSCPHWQRRLRYGAECKHHRLVKEVESDS
jgi:hypothetical protein